jgi:hypothetical protein
VVCHSVIDGNQTGNLAGGNYGGARTATDFHIWLTISAGTLFVQLFGGRTVPDLGDVL